jgi:hypothetical protein
MITKFETGAVASNQGNSKGSSTLLYLIVGAVGVYLLYKYVLKPEMDKGKDKKQ